MDPSPNQRLEIPGLLREKLIDFRRRVWTIKIIEAVAGATAGVLLGYLLTFALDRFIDTPAMVRGLIFTAAMLVCAMIPWTLNRWVWQRRRLDQLARLLMQKHPDIGDQLLGVIELAEDDEEQNRSRVLVKAAIRQVTLQAEQKDFSNAVPRPRHRIHAVAAISLALVAIGLWTATTIAAGNAWKRYLAPWSATPRYTYAAVEDLPDQIVVPHGEPFSIPVVLRENTEWSPGEGEARLAGVDPVKSTLKDQRYEFPLPAQIAPGSLNVTIGDYYSSTQIEPKLRPELVDLTATFILPEYLQRSKALEKNIRGGTVNVVRGSAARLSAVVSRDLAEATINSRPAQHSASTIRSERVAVNDPTTLEFAWKDVYGLSGLQPFQLEIVPTEDEAPNLVCENLPRKKILLDSEVLTFNVKARDDFGVRRVGIEWKGLDPTLNERAEGEKLIGAGNPEAELLELVATFSGKQFGIAPQPVEVRLFVEDYLPNRERVYSPSCIYFILDPDQHAIWVTDQLSRWHRLALDIRDRELQLHETNKELRGLDPGQLDDSEVRRRIEAQAAAERANGRRLGQLIGGGEDLLRQAMRNPEIGVGHLDRWAEMMQVLKDISGNRMPSVADLLNDAAKAPQVAGMQPARPTASAGQNRLKMAGSGSKKSEEQKGEAPPVVPQLTDIESTRNELGKGEAGQSKPKSPRLTLPNTMLAGNGEGKKPETPAGEQMEEAVQEQKDLLAEFEKIADELNEILANLEGSTLVKRLKAASRRQEQVAGRLATHASEAFGVEKIRKVDQVEEFKSLSTVEVESSKDVSYIMDDMAAYFERSRYNQFKVVLDQMREERVVEGLRDLSDELVEESGLSIAQAEFWSESLDRWAEDLVEVTKCGACPGCKAKGSLPPSIVLEVLQILEGEIDLREQTRVAEQARTAVSVEEHEEEAGRLSKAQKELQKRIDDVVLRILELPDAESDFAKELRLLDAVSRVMVDATQILARPDTGSSAIAAETEAIELLLQSKRFNPNGGGGGGSNPGGGGTGTTSDTALALVGSGVNEKEVRENTGTNQATGNAGPVLPEEFRSGLDEYFQRIDETSPSN
ncbi:hypothetical protein [Rubinisphaera margarita]|uniref:hypothetical protein n=1 Tax=Rubinisphaera margarita TaxID=2909586 RepID=UPI001EE7F3D0|nr:hypothetical protein [Rubinisphaera margarita]MCG6156404.1 hypothetical protein [Rubinisphaera margarita]